MDYCVIGERAVVSVNNGNFVVCFHRPNVLEMVGECFRVARNKFSGAAFVTAILQQGFSVNGGTRLAPNRTEALKEADFIFDACVAPYSGMKTTISLTLVSQGKLLLRPLFQGLIDNFPEFLKTCTALDHLVGKTVQFRYKGGSEPNEIRTVRVEQVSKAPGGYILIDGLDLAKLVLERVGGDTGGSTVVTDGWRRYSTEKISGDIKVLA